MALNFETDAVRYDLENRIATITLNRPHQGNAIIDEIRR